MTISPAPSTSDYPTFTADWRYESGKSLAAVLRLTFANLETATRTFEATPAEIGNVLAQPAINAVPEGLYARLETLVNSPEMAELPPHELILLSITKTSMRALGNYLYILEINPITSPSIDTSAELALRDYLATIASTYSTIANRREDEVTALHALSHMFTSMQARYIAIELTPIELTESVISPDAGALADCLDYIASNNSFPDNSPIILHIARTGTRTDGTPLFSSSICPPLNSTGPVAPAQAPDLSRLQPGFSDPTAPIEDIMKELASDIDTQLMNITLEVYKPETATELLSSLNEVREKFHRALQNDLII